MLSVMNLSHESLGRDLLSGGRLTGLALVGDLGQVTPLSLHLILHSLQPAVRQSHVVAAPSVAPGVLTLLVAKHGLVVGVRHPVLELVGRSLVDLLASTTSQEEEQNQDH